MRETCKHCGTTYEYPDGVKVGRERTLNAGVPVRAAVIEVDANSRPVFRDGEVHIFHRCEHGKPVAGAVDVVDG